MFSTEIPDAAVGYYSMCSVISVINTFTQNLIRIQSLQTLTFRNALQQWHQLERLNNDCELKIPQTSLFLRKQSYFVNRVSVVLFSS